MSEIVLSYGDSLIRKSDLELLQPGCWLNDTIIGFYFEYLQTHLHSDLPQVLLIGPEVTQFIKLVSKQEVPAILEPLGFSDKELVLFCINSLDRPDVAGGSHWSLLAFQRSTNTFHHFDSASSYNLDEARSLAGNLSDLTSIQSANVEVANSLQQTNGHDCGVFLLKHAENIISHYKTNGTLRDLPQLVMTEVNAFREELHSLIL